ncbi:MAG: hypothetical protein AAGD14_02000 [Planctomycetota bacterium]
MERAREKLTRAAAWTGIVLILVWTSCARQAVSGPRGLPDGSELLEVSRRAPSDAFMNAYKVPGMDLIATDLTGPGRDLVLIGPDGHSRLEVELAFEVMAPGHRKGEILAVDGRTYYLLSVTELREGESISRRTARHIRGFPLSRDACRTRTGWCLLSKGGDILEIRNEPFEVGRGARFRFKTATRCAYDARTDALVIAGTDGEIRVVDWKTFRLRHRLQIPDTEFRRSLCVWNGRAWIGTRRGSFVHYDIARNVVREETTFGSPDGDVMLALCDSGARLAATSSKFVSGRVHPTVLSVWDIGPEELTLRARTETTLSTTTWNIGLFETEDRLFIAGQYPAYIWSFGSARRE